MAIINSKLLNYRGYQRVIMKWLGFYPTRNWDSNWDSESGGMHTKSGLIFVRKTMNNYWTFRGFTMFYPPSSGKLRPFQWKPMKKQSLQDEDRSYIFRMSERLQSTKWPSKFLYLPLSWNLGVVFFEHRYRTALKWALQSTSIKPLFLIPCPNSSSIHSGQRAGGISQGLCEACEDPRHFSVLKWICRRNGVYTPKKKFMGIDKVLDLEDFRGILFLDKPKWQCSSTFKVYPIIKTNTSKSLQSQVVVG